MNAAQPESSTNAAQPAAAPARPVSTSRRIASWAMLCALVLPSVWYIVNHAGTWKDRFVPRRLRVVEPGRIYASGQINRHLIRGVLVEDHIQQVISLVLNDPTDVDEVAEQAAAKEMGIRWDRYPLSGDGTGDIHSYADAVAKIVEAQNQNMPVLVHCSSGAQRSNGATFFYRVFVQQWTADDAAAEMIRNGHDPHHNPVLIPYLNSHMKEMAQLLLQRGVIKQIPDPLPQIHRAG